MAYTKTQKKTDPDAETLDMVMGKFNAYRDYYKRGFKATWASARKLYNAQRVAVNYEGNSDTFVPETFTIVQSVKSNVVGGKIKTEFMPTRNDQTGDTKVLNAMMDQIWVQDNTKLKSAWAVDDSLQVGNGYLWQGWNGQYPTNQYIPTEDNWFDIDATNYTNLTRGGYRYLTTKDVLENETVTNPDYDETDPKSKLKIPRYKNLDKVDSYTSFKTGNDKTAKQLREEMVAGSVMAGKDIVEVIVYHDLKKQIRVANRCTVIEDIDTPFKRDKTVIQSADDEGNPIPVEIPEIKPFIPVAPARDYVDGAMWLAKGEIEVIGDLQELLNDTQNQKSDNINFALNRMWALDPSQAHKKDEIQSIPGAVFTIPPGSLEAINTPPLGPEADNEMYRIQKMMRSATAADEIIQGSSPRGTQTATEINSQMIQAGTRFASKLENFESEFFAILSNNMFKILQIFMTQEMAVRMIGQEGVEWKDYNPGEYLGDWDVKVSLEANARAIKEEEKQSAMQFYLMSSKLAFVNQEVLFKATADKLFDLDASLLDKLIIQVNPPEPEKPKVSVSLKGEDIGPQASAMLAEDAVGQPPQQPQASGLPQEGAGAAASNPQGAAANAASAGIQQGAGLNVPGVPQA